jgi:sec-independent protein translocase protein TatB
MPQIGWSELLVIAIIAILVIGPKDLPLIMKKFGSWIKTIKSYTSNFQNSLENISDVETIDIAEEDNKKKRKTKKNKLDS